MFSYPYILPTSSYISSGIEISVLNTGGIIVIYSSSSFVISYSIFKSIFLISSFDRLVPKCEFNLDTDRDSFLGFVGSGYISMTLDAISPLASSCTSSAAFSRIGRHSCGACPLVNLVTASVNIPSSIEVFLILYLLKLALSIMIFFVLLSTCVSMLPITPAIAIGLVESAITRLSSLSSTIFPSSV